MTNSPSSQQETSHGTPRLPQKSDRSRCAVDASDFEASLKTLQTNHFDLYQLHALTKVEEVEQSFAPAGAVETFLQARKDGKIRYLGFSARQQIADDGLAAAEQNRNRTGRSPKTRNEFDRLRRI